MTVKNIFDKETINYYKKNKHLITEDLLKQLRSIGNEGKEIALQILDTEKTEDNYYLDAFGKKISHDGNRNQKPANCQMKLSEIHIKEIEKCKNDLMYFKDNYVKIRTKKGITFPDIRPYQEEFLKYIIDKEAENIASLQGRQSGKTVGVSIALAWYFNFFQNINIGICANKGKLAREFLNNVKVIFENLPMWLRVGVLVWNTETIKSETETRILTDVPGENCFRGFTCEIIVVDEVAFINPNLWKVMEDSIFPAQSSCSWKKNILISTPNGLNHWKTICEKAKKSKNYRFHFVDWRDVPRYNIKGERLTPEEFKNKILEDFSKTFFLQNYACEFIGSSHTLIDPEILKNLTSTNRIDVWDRTLNIFHQPEKNHNYIMAIDPAKAGGDAFAIQVIDVTSKPFIQVASGQIFQANFQTMPIFIDEWARQYNYAFLIIENNEGAGTYINAILKQDFEYPNLFFEKNQSRTSNKSKAFKEAGFRTTSKSRDQILEILKNLLNNNLLILNDENTINELYTFVLKNDKFQADDGFHDDMVMALAIAFCVFCNIKNFDNMKDVVAGLYNTDQNSNFKLTDHFVIGNFDQYTDSDFESDKMMDEFSGFGNLSRLDY